MIRNNDYGEKRISSAWSELEKEKGETENKIFAITTKNGPLNYVCCHKFPNCCKTVCTEYLSSDEITAKMLAVHVPQLKFSYRTQFTAATFFFSRGRRHFLFVSFVSPLSISLCTTCSRAFLYCEPQHISTTLSRSTNSAEWPIDYPLGRAWTHDGSPENGRLSPFADFFLLQAHFRNLRPRAARSSAAVQNVSAVYDISHVYDD